jgi:condensin complex subunit 3
VCGDVAHDGDGDVEEDKKVLCQVLGRLHLPETVDDDKIRTPNLLCTISLRYLCLFPFLYALPLVIPPRCGTDRSETSRPQRPLQIRHDDQQEVCRRAGWIQRGGIPMTRAARRAVSLLVDIVPLDDGEEVEQMKTRGRKRCVFLHVARAWAAVPGMCADGKR